MTSLGDLLQNLFFKTAVDTALFTLNETAYLGIEQIQAHSVIHDITIVGHIPVAAQRKGTVCLKSISKHRSKQTKCRHFLERLHTNTVALIKLRNLRYNMTIWSLTNWQMFNWTFVLRWILKNWTHSCMSQTVQRRDCTSIRGYCWYQCAEMCGRCRAAWGVTVENMHDVKFAESHRIWDYILSLKKNNERLRKSFLNN